MGQIIDPNSLLIKTDKQPATVAFLNNLINQLCFAMNGVGVRMDGYDAAVQNLVNLGLANINSTLGPFLTTLQEAASLGFLVGEADGQSNALTVGLQFDMALTNQGAELFTPTKWLTMMDVNDYTNWGICQLISWVPQDTNLSTMCIYASKNKASNSWQVACGSGVLSATINAMTSASASATNAASSATSAAASASSVAGLAGAIAAGPVVSVAGRSGAVILAEADIGGLVADLAARPLTSFLNSQIAGLQPHSATLDALAALTYSSFVIALLGAANAGAAMNTLGAAPLASPVFTGAPKAPTPTGGDSSTNLATTAFVGTAVSSAGYVTSSALTTALAGYQQTTANLPSAQITASFNDQVGTTYTFVASDYGKVVTFSNASPITVTVPNNLPKGWNAIVYEAGNGQVTFNAASGATVSAAGRSVGAIKTSGPYAMVTLLVVSNSNGSSAAVAVSGSLG